MNYRRLSTFLLSVAVITTAVLAFPAGSKAEAKKETSVGFYLDTVITLTAYVEDVAVLNDALAECGRYEDLLSRTKEGSDVWRINHAEGAAVRVSDETIEILRTAQSVSELSGGTFDVTIAPVSTLWNFTTEPMEVPDAEAIAEAAGFVDYRKISIDGNDITLPDGMMIDLGGIAKGWIADAVKHYLEERGVKSGILSFGGNIVAIGVKPDGTPWKVGIQDIDRPTGSYMLVAQNFGGSTVTSGIYERGFESDGVYYHHILDPDTGWPVQNELASVTIFSESSMWGDALATAAFSLGTEAGLQLIESLDGIEAVFIARDRKATYSSGAGDYMIQ
ncbi:MAG: FAD:protein FMN transferase [Clostridia bacterium]|nr:FAD:protein FMN transferase [Clostridia bacterium]